MASDERVAGPAGGVAGSVPVIWGNVPQRNKHFTGRSEVLADVRRRLVGHVTAVLPHALHGMGGVGKTQLAVEYAYRYKSDYELVWWIPSDQVPLIRSSLAALAPRLGIDVAEGRVEEARIAVLDALRRGEPYKNWLIIFDNADQPEDLREFLPAGDGHVIVTSRNHRWESVADVVEVDVFSRPESLEFLTRRVIGITKEDANRLAEELGDLPLALEQAGALQVEAGISVEEYLGLLSEKSRELLDESPTTDYPVPVVGAFKLSMEQLKLQMPFAWELLRRCAFFSPEPISRELLKNGRYVLGPPLRDGLDDPIVLGQATRELGRYALARVDNNRRTLQLHRLIQRLIRDEMEPNERSAIRDEVHRLLAAADIDEPDDIANWPRYEELLAHVRPSGVLESKDRKARRLVRNVVRYLFNFGDLPTSQDLASDAIAAWTEESGPDDEDVLILSGQQASLLWTQGKYEQAYGRRQDTLDRMRRVLGEDHPETLRVMNGYGADLRARGEFADALHHDEDALSRHHAAFGPDDPRTFSMANNVAVDQVLNGRYADALDTDTKTHQDRIDFYGRNDHPLVVWSLSAMATDYRLSGRYPEALTTAEQAYAAFTDLVTQRLIRADHPFVLGLSRELSVARRKMGQLGHALDLAEEVLAKYLETFGEKHPEALAAAMNVGNARRVHGDINRNRDAVADAADLTEKTYRGYGEAYGSEHPCTYACAVNLAVVFRRIDEVEQAARLVDQALDGLQRRLGNEHHYTLACMTVKATVLADAGDRTAARELGQRAFDGLSRVLGPDHPNTLVAAANVALDMQALGDEQEAAALRADVIQRYRSILPPDHIDVKDTVKGERMTLDFEPPSL